MARVAPPLKGAAALEPAVFVGGLEDEVLQQWQNKKPTQRPAGSGTKSGTRRRKGRQAAENGATDG